MAADQPATDPVGKKPDGASGTLVAVSPRTDQPAVFVHHVKEVPDLTKDFTEVTAKQLDALKAAAKAADVTLVTKEA